MEFTGVRVIPGATPERVYNDHIARYEFASKFVLNKKVLDIACGTGYGSEYLKLKGAREVIGVDNSEDALLYARKHYTGDNLMFINGDVTKLDFDNDTFDMVVSFETIEHLKSYVCFLSEIYRVLKKNGILLLSSPNRLVTSPAYPKYKKIPDNKFHFVEFSLEEMRDLLSTNFHEFEFFGQHNINKVLIYPLVRKIISRVFSNKFCGGIYVETKNPSVEKILYFCLPRYFVILCRKN